MEYNITLKTLNIPLESGGVKLTHWSKNITCVNGFDLCCAALDFVNNFGAESQDGRKIIVDMKKAVETAARATDETSLRSSSKLHINDSLYMLTIVCVDSYSDL